MTNKDRVFIICVNVACSAVVMASFGGVCEPPNGEGPVACGG